MSAYFPTTYTRPKHPACIAAEECLELEELARQEERARWNSEEARAGRRMWRNMCLSGGSLEVFEALQLGESVPIELLDPAQVKRFGLR